MLANRSETVRAILHGGAIDVQSWLQWELRCNWSSDLDGRRLGLPYYETWIHRLQQGKIARGDDSFSPAAVLVEILRTMSSLQDGDQVSVPAHLVHAWSNAVRRAHVHHHHHLDAGSRVPAAILSEAKRCATEKKSRARFLVSLLSELGPEVLQSSLFGVFDFADLVLSSRERGKSDDSFAVLLFECVREHARHSSARVGDKTVSAQPMAPLCAGTLNESIAMDASMQIAVTSPLDMEHEMELQMGASWPEQFPRVFDFLVAHWKTLTRYSWANGVAAHEGPIFAPVIREFASQYLSL